MRTAGFTMCLSFATRFLLPALFLVLILVSSGGASPSAMELLTSGHVDELVQDLQHQIAHSPNDAAADNLLCRAYFMMEEWDRGIAACERAVNLDPQNSSYYLWLGRSYGEKADRSGFLSAAGLAKKSRAAFERAVELDPKNVEAHVDLGEFYAEAPGIIGGGREKAYRQADELMPLNPAMAHWVLARIAEKEKDPAKAEREYRAEIAASNSGVRGWVDLANFFMYAHRYEDMENALQHARGRSDRSSRVIDECRQPAASGTTRLSPRHSTSPALSCEPIVRRRSSLQSARDSRRTSRKDRRPAGCGPGISCCFSIV